MLPVAYLSLVKPANDVPANPTHSSQPGGSEQTAGAGPALLIHPEGEMVTRLRDLLCECGRVRNHGGKCDASDVRLRLALQHCVDYLRAQAEREGYRSWPLRYAERVMREVQR